MSRNYNDDNDKAQQIEETSIIRSEKERITSGKNVRERKLRYDQLGICAKCHSLHAETTQYGKQSYWCYHNDRRLHKLSPNDPLVDCTDFWDIAHISLKDLMALAIPIHIDVNKRPMGFIYREADDPFSDD